MRLAEAPKASRFLREGTSLLRFCFASAKPRIFGVDQSELRPCQNELSLWMLSQAEFSRARGLPPSDEVGWSP